MTLLTHDRTLFHTGTEDATTAVLASPIGRYHTGATVQAVLEDLDRRLTFIESSACSLHIHAFTASAYLLLGASFSANAYIHQGGAASVTANAVIYGTETDSFTADAFLLEVVCP